MLLPHAYAPGTLPVEDREDVREIDSKESRVLRGGSFDINAQFVRSAGRTTIVPSIALNVVGLRPARTFR